MAGGLYLASRSRVHTRDDYKGRQRSSDRDAPVRNDNFQWYVQSQWSGYKWDLWAVKASKMMLFLSNPLLSSDVETTRAGLSSRTELSLETKAIRSQFQGDGGPHRHTVVSRFAGVRLELAKEEDILFISTWKNPGEESGYPENAMATPISLPRWARWFRS